MLSGASLQRVTPSILTARAAYCWRFGGIGARRQRGDRYYAAGWLMDNGYAGQSNTNVVPTKSERSNDEKRVCCRSGQSARHAT